MFPLRDRDPPEPGRALPDLAQPPERRQVCRRRTSRCSGAMRCRCTRHATIRAASPRSRWSRGHFAGVHAAVATAQLRGPRATTATLRSGRSAWRRTRASCCRAPCAGSNRSLYFFRGSGLVVAERRQDAHARVGARPRGRRAARGRSGGCGAPSASGQADRRAGRAVRPVRDEQPRRDRAGDARLPSGPSSAAGPGRATVPCTIESAAASRATPTAGSRKRNPDGVSRGASAAPGSPPRGARFARCSPAPR